MHSITDILARAAVIPVLEVADASLGAKLAQALAKGGLTVVEMTLRTPAALDAMRAMKEAAPALIVGMGTILSAGDVKRAAAAGADFLVTPGTTSDVLGALKSAGLPALPGVATASEAMTAREAGFVALKFFPAEQAGGAAYLKALAGPLPDVVFCPTGGISEAKAPDYLALPNVACVGGSWVASRKMIAEGRWAEIEANARRAAALR